MPDSFWGYSEKEIRKHLAYHLQEAEYDASLVLLGAIEAAFRLDFDYCYTKKLKDKRSIAVRNLAKDAIARGVVHSYKIPITELCELLEHSSSIQKHEITLLKVYFNYRHWLAHGRYWQLKLGRSKPTFMEIYEIAKTLKNLLNS